MKKKSTSRRVASTRGSHKKPTGRNLRARGRHTALLHRSEVVEFLTQHASRIAAPDVALLVSERDSLLAKAAAFDEARFDPFRRQLADALHCLADYVAVRCPQIPYYTVAVLAAAVFYFRNPVNAVPDFLPRFGVVDDALVMAVATEMVADGLARYHIWQSSESEFRPRRGAPVSTC